MLILHDFYCEPCDNKFEELSEPEELIHCPTCELELQPVPITKPYAESYMLFPVRQKEIMMKGRAIRSKLLGKTPWRKNSESQSS